MSFLMTCRHGPKRADYTSDWLYIINWAQVSNCFGLLVSPNVPFATGELRGTIEARMGALGSMLSATLR